MKKTQMLILLMTAVAVLMVTGSAVGQDKGGDKTASFAVQKGGKLDIEISYGDITIIPWEKDEVYVDASGYDEEELDRLRIKGDKNLVTIKLRINGDRSGGGDGEFEVNVPSEFNIELETGGGTITIKGDIKGSVNGSSGGGNIILKNVTSGNLTLSTGGGDIRAGASGGDVKLSTGGGNIDMEDIKGDVKGSTGGGNIRLGKVDGVADLSTGGGNISLEGAGGDVKLSTGGGNVNVRDISGKVRISTGGGTVDLEEIMGSITASTGGGDITATLKPSGKGDSKLTTGGGDIKLYIPEDAKVVIEAAIEIPRKWSRNIKKYKIQSDFKADKFEQNEEDEEIRAVYVLNGGGETVTLRTTSSNIHILKSGK